MPEAKPRKADPLIGKTLEKVRLLEKLGAGGMGTVYLAEHATLARRVAVKVLPDALSRDPEFVSRFLSEAKTTSKLDHPNIVQVHDIGYADGKYFITMQHVDGESLHRIIEAMGPLDPSDAARVMIGVLRGLHYAHTRGVVHRDIKPDNILIGPHNEPKILDFGLAIETEASLRLTAAGTIIGTPWFISPEQARGHRADARSDIYSAGVTLYTMLTGRPPFTAQGSLAVLNKHIHDTPVSPLTLNPRVPPALDAIVLKMMAKRPEDRYLTAETAARDLEAFLEHRPVSMARTTRANPTAPPTRPRTLVWLLLATSAVLACWLTWSAARTPPSLPPRKPEPLPALIIDDPGRADVEAARGAIDKIQQDFQALQHDLAVWPETHQRYVDLRTRYANNAQASAIIDEASAQFLRVAEERAQAQASPILEEVEALLRDDPYEALAAYNKFPRPLLTFTETGRGIEKARCDLDAQLQKELPKQLASIERMITEEDFHTAQSRMDYLRRFVGPIHQPKLRELAQLAEEKKGIRMAQIEPDLRERIARLETELFELLTRGRSDTAWQTLLAFITARPITKLEGRLVRVDGIDYVALSDLTPEDLNEGHLDRQALELAERQNADDPAHHLLLLFEDVLRREWLLRRVARGITAASGITIHLQTFGPGRLTAGTPPSFTAENGVSKSFDPRELPPSDLIQLAAIATYGREDAVAQAWHSDVKLCAAAGIAYLTSTVVDRFHASHRWSTRAEELGAVIPPFRMNRLREELKHEAARLRETYLRSVATLGQQKQFEEAHRELDQLEKKVQGQDLHQTLAYLIGKERASLYIAEAQVAREARNFARVREIIVKQLRARFTGLYAPEEVDPLFQEAVLHLGSWKDMPIPSVDLSKSTWWTWPDRDKTPPPAKIEGETLRMESRIPLFLAPDRTQGLTGASTRFRLNEKRSPFSAGLRFNVTTTDATTQRWIYATSEGELVLYGHDPTHGFSKLRTAPLPVRMDINTWHSVAFVVEGEEIFFYFDGHPLIAAPERLLPSGFVAISCEGDFSFSQIRVRDVKPR